MATVSEVETALNNIKLEIADGYRAREEARAVLIGRRERLTTLPQRYLDAITTIDGYAPTGAQQTLAKDLRAKLTDEYEAVLAQIAADVAALTG